MTARHPWAFVIACVLSAGAATGVQGASSVAASVASGPLPPGRYRFDLTLVSSAIVPVFGPQTTTTQTLSLFDVDAVGFATQTLCVIDTRGAAFRVVSRGPFPLQRFAIDVDDTRVRWDPGVLDLGWDRTRGAFPGSLQDSSVVDTDHDGTPGLGMKLDLGVLGSYQLQIASAGRTTFRGVRTDDGARGSAEVLEAQQRILVGAPFDGAGSSRVDSASFTLRRVDDDAACASVQATP